MTPFDQGGNIFINNLYCFILCFGASGHSFICFMFFFKIDQLLTQSYSYPNTNLVQCSAVIIDFNHSRTQGGEHSKNKNISTPLETVLSGTKANK